MKWGSPAKLAGMTDSLAGLKNIGPATIRQLKEVGIDDVATLRQLGAMAAYRA